jgi:hypothetical protein
MSAQEFKVLLERIDYYTNPRNASLDPLGGERYQVFRTKGKRVNDKNRVSKREQKSKRKKRKEQRREVRGLGDLLEQLDIQGGLATERREKKAGQGAEGGSKDMQVHASLHASLLPDDCSMEMS